MLTSRQQFSTTSMRELTFTEAAREGLAEEMERDPMVFVVGEGIGARGGNFATTLGLFERFGPERVRDTPIVERGFTGLCTGAALMGARPVVDYMFFDFALDALGEIINQTAKIQYMSDGRLKMPIVLRGCVGIGSSAATHHSGSYYSLFAHVPGLRVVAPTTPRDAKGLLKAAIRSDDPVVFMEHRGLLALRGPVPDAEADEVLPFGCASVRRQGNDLTIVGIAHMVTHALAAADELASSGVLGRGHRPTHAGAPGHGHDAGIGGQNGPPAGRRRGLCAVWRGRRNRGPGRGPRVRRPGRAGPTTEQPARAGSVQPAARGGHGPDAVEYRSGSPGSTGGVKIVQTVRDLLAE